jgi:hypothetical protein
MKVLYNVKDEPSSAIDIVKQESGINEPDPSENDY